MPRIDRISCMRTLLSFRQMRPARVGHFARVKGFDGEPNSGYSRFAGEHGHSNSPSIFGRQGNVVKCFASGKHV